MTRGEPGDGAAGGPSTLDEPADRSPGDILAIAGSETRLSILRALFEAESNRLGYADLMDVIGMRDSGQFNYHLTKLVGPFVRKTEDGYELRHAGGQVVGAILAGAYDDDRDLGPVTVEAPCLDCGGTLLATYEGDFATIACEDCGGVVTRDSVPPGVFTGYDEADVPSVLGRWIRHGFARTVDGFCPVCAGRTDATLGAPEHEERGGVGVEIRCRRCGMRFTGGLGSVVLAHPAVVSFHYDHGVDLRRTPLWELDWLAGGSATLVDDPPTAARLAIELDDERLVLSLSAALDVLSVERGPR